MSATQTPTITDAPTKWECPRHGTHDATMHVTIFGTLKRVYCMHCYIEHLDKVGVQEMTPAKRDAR